MEQIKYTDKGDAYWRKLESDFKAWINEKYKYCRAHTLNAFAESTEDGGNYMYPVIMNILTEKNTMSDAVKNREITAESLYEAFKLYSQFIAEVNSYCLLIPSKQNFCSFINLPVRTFNNLQNSNDEDLASVVDTINDYITTNLAYAGQLGAAKTSIVSLLLKADEAGQGIMTAKESKTTQNSGKEITIEDIQSKLKALKGE